MPASVDLNGRAHLARRPVNGVSTSDGAKTKYTKPTPIWFSEPLDEEAFGYWEADEVSLHGSEIDLSQDGRKGSGAEMPSVFKNNARGLCDAG